MPPTDVNVTLADITGSASFLLTAVALLITAVAIAFGAWANLEAKRTEAQTKRLDLSYRLMITAAGGGDALLNNATTHYSNSQVQIAAMAALRSFPEYAAVFERLLEDRKRMVAKGRAELDMDQASYDKALLAELVELHRAVTTGSARKHHLWSRRA